MLDRIELHMEWFVDERLIRKCEVAVEGEHCPLQALFREYSHLGLSGRCPW